MVTTVVQRTRPKKDNPTVCPAFSTRTMTPNDSPAPDTAATAAASSPSSAPRRGRWPWIAAVLALALMAAGAWYWWPTGASQPAQGARGRPDQAGRPLPVVAARGEKGSIDIYLNALGTVTPRNTVVVRSRVDGQLMRVAVREGQIGEGGRPAGRDRSAAVPGAAHAGAGAAGARPGAARERADRPRALSHAARAGFDRQAAGRHAGVARAPVRGRGRRPTRAQIDNAKLQLTYTPHHRADRRARRPAPGRPRQHRARRRRERPRGDHAAQPITVVFTMPEDSAAAR